MRKLKRKQMGFVEWLAPIASVATALIGSESQEDTNNMNRDATIQGQQYNAEQAERNRQFQAEQRRTQYQTAVGDLKAAGLNPMLAYQNGGAGMANGATASTPAPIPMQNKMQAGLNSAAAAAQIMNVRANTELLEAQKEKTMAEVPLTTANTGQVVQKTENMKQELHNLREEMGKIIANRELLVKQGWTQTDIGNLYKAQTDVAKIEQQLKASQITQVEAQTLLTRVEQQLKGFEVQGAKNQESWEKFMSDDNLGNASKATRALAETIRAIKGLR